MKNLNRTFFVILFFAHFSLQAADSDSEFQRPTAKIWLETEANKMLSRIDQNKSVLLRNDKALQKFLYDNAIPFWDTRLMAKGLGGLPYRQASNELKSNLEEQWKLTLVRYFLKAFPYYDDQRLVLEDEFNCPSENRCWLKTQIDIAGKKAIDLDFYVRWHKQSSGDKNWQVIDLRVAGVSLLKHKRGETRAILKEKGIVGLIAVLKNKNVELLVSAVEPGV